MRHQWKSQQQGGSPDDAASCECVTYCDECGVEQDDDNRDAECVSDELCKAEAVSRIRSAKRLLEASWPYHERSDAENAVLANLDFALGKLGWDTATKGA